MSAADDAYRAAQRLIAKAKEEGLETLDFDTSHTHALTRLPLEIADLTTLRTLSLSSTEVADFTPISALTKLRALHLRYTQISDLAPLTSLTGLKRLYLDGTQISDLSPLSALSELSTLYLVSTQVSDLSPLGVLSGLIELALDDTQVTDLAPLKRLQSLTSLSIGGTRVVDLSPLNSLFGLNELYLNANPVSDIAPIGTLSGLRVLYLSGTEIDDFSPLAALTGIKVLYLANSKITDLTPLVSLTELQALCLDFTPIADLRPLSGLLNLVERPARFGLSFIETTATGIDPNIADISKIEDPATRAGELFAYLETWMPSEDVTAPPKPDPLFETVLIDGQLELAPDPPTQAERDEVLKRALHERLQVIAPDLARAAGNHFPLLASKARVLAALVEKPFEQLDLLSIHFEVETLHDRLERGTEGEIPFPDDVLGPLSDVTRAGPGLTLGHPSVDTHLQRVREARSNPSPAEDEAAHRSLSDAIVQDADANGPLSRSMEVRVAAQEDPAQRQAGWTAKHRWALWTLGSVVGTVSVNVASNRIDAAFGEAISSFVVTNAALLWEVALTYGPGFSTWFAAAMAPIYAEFGVAAEIIQRMRKRR